MANADTAKKPDRVAALFLALLRAPSVLALLIANLLPIYGVVALGWDLFSLMMVYWLETGIIGLFAILNIAMNTGWRGLTLAPFFLVHFGGFMFGHLLFLITLFSDKKDTEFSHIPAVLWDIVTTKGLLFIVGGLFVSHAIAFIIYVFMPWWRILLRGELKGDTETGVIMGAPYGRVIVMHVTILFGAILASVFQNKIAFLVLLIALKTASDLWSLLRRPAPEPVVVH